MRALSTAGSLAGLLIVPAVASAPTGTAALADSGPAATAASGAARGCFATG
ncbi:MAG: hypothetical protein ACLQFR_01775 [Streptosporangiaceae bacterium]